MSKLLSGRWLLTVVAAGVFLYASIEGKLNPAEVKEILIIIILFYFNKERQQKGE
jgi:hypothetical protein